MLAVTPIGVAVAVGVAVLVELIAVAVAVAVRTLVAITVAVAVGVAPEAAGFNANAIVAHDPLVIEAESGDRIPGATRALSATPSAICDALRNGTNARELRSAGIVRPLLPPLMNPTYSSLLEFVLKEHKVGVVLFP